MELDGGAAAAAAAAPEPAPDVDAELRLFRPLTAAELDGICPQTSGAVRFELLLPAAQPVVGGGSPAAAAAAATAAGGANVAAEATGCQVRVWKAVGAYIRHHRSGLEAKRPCRCQPRG